MSKHPHEDQSRDHQRDEQARQGQQQSRTAGVPSQPLEPPLPPATSAPPRQEPPNPTPKPDAPHDQRDRTNEFGVDRATLTPEQRVGIVTEPHPPQKFRRPLAQAGDPDYVAGMPVNEEEARRMEQLEEDRYAYAMQAGKDAEANRAPDAELDRQNEDAPKRQGDDPRYEKAREAGETDDQAERRGRHSKDK